MHATSSGAGRGSQCPSCEGTGKSAAAREAERVAGMSGAERIAAFRQLDEEARSRMFESDRGMYESLRDAEREL